MRVHIVYQPVGRKNPVTLYAGLTPEQYQQIKPLIDNPEPAEDEVRVYCGERPRGPKRDRLLPVKQIISMQIVD